MGACISSQHKVTPDPTGQKYVRETTFDSMSSDDLYHMEMHLKESLLSLTMHRDLIRIRYNELRLQHFVKPSESLDVQLKHIEQALFHNRNKIRHCMKMVEQCEKEVEHRMMDTRIISPCNTPV